MWEVNDEIFSKILYENIFSMGFDIGYRNKI